MKSPINVVIFSKDRANQVEACIRSFLKHFEQSEQSTISVLYKASTPSFNEGYKKAKGLLTDVPNLQWVIENNFSKQTRSLINCVDAPLTMFLVDDIIFINSVSLEDKQVRLLENPSLLAVSLRLHAGVKSCYATNQPTLVPRFVKGCVWDWQQAEGDWNYPMSVDGNIYRTDLIKQLLAALQFTNPNTLEAAFDAAKGSSGMPRHLCCYPNAPRLINIPANRVQNLFENRFAKGYSAEELNKLLLNGKRIDTAQYAGLKPEMVHVPIELMFESVPE